MIWRMNPLAKLAVRVLRDPKFRALMISLGPAAAKAAGDLARQGRWRQLAIVHADTLVDGSFMKVPIRGEPHWVVWSGDIAVTAYPVHEGDLDHVVKNVDLSKRQRPDELRVRAAREEAADRARRLRDGLTARRSGRRGLPAQTGDSQPRL